MTLQLRISKCTYPTRRFFQDLEPLLRKAHMYGWLEESIDGLAARFAVSPAWLYGRLGELQKHGILRRGKNGLYCPFIVGEIVLRKK